MLGIIPTVLYIVLAAVPLETSEEIPKPYLESIKIFIVKESHIGLAVSENLRYIKIQ